MVEAKTIYTYLGAIAVILAVSAYKNKFGDANSRTDELIREYLLNESPLYGMNKPKLWIHTIYNINARAWRADARNTSDLNQPYIHLLVRTVINKCGDDFNVCLIDDTSFKNLLPEFEFDSTNLTKTQREYAFMQLLYVYGGIVIPNSFLCMNSLLPLLSEESSPKFGNGTSVMSAHKACPKIRELMEKWLTINGYFETSENTFDNKKLNLLAKMEVEQIDPRLLGKADQKKKPILLDDLLSENYLVLSDDLYGILIDGDEVLQRKKHRWLATITTNKLLETQCVMVKYIKAALADEAFSSVSKPSIMAI